MSETSEINPEQQSSLLEPSKTNTLASDLQNLGIAIRLDGKNYLQWARLVKLALKGKQKLQYLSEDPPAKDDKKFHTWDVEDTVIMTWLLNSMQIGVSQNFMFLESSKQIWEAVKKTYSKAQDAAVIYDLKTRIAHTKQDNEALLQERERDRVFEFLAGLNVELDQVRIQILGKDPLPSLNETFALVRGEERRRSVMLENVSASESALTAAKESRHIGPKPEPRKNPSRDDLWCTHCNKPRHTRENCFKLHGKERVLKRIKQRRNEANFIAQGKEVESATANKEEVQILSTEEIEKLRHFLETITASSTSLAHSGNHSGKCLISDALKAHNTVSTSWILDSGATDHMTHSSHWFNIYNPSSNEKSIFVADGKSITVKGQGNINLSPTLSLKNVLHVPQISNNLISIHQLTEP